MEYLEQLLESLRGSVVVADTSELTCGSIRDDQLLLKIV